MKASLINGVILLGVVSLFAILAKTINPEHYENQIIIALLVFIAIKLWV